MECEYEQKFISGVDPTITYMDILSNALRFGTSNSYDYGLSGKFAGKLKKWVNDPQSLITDFATSLKNGLNAASSLMRKSIEDAFSGDLDF
jgi:hypothetical protein